MSNSSLVYGNPVVNVSVSGYNSTFNQTNDILLLLIAIRITLDVVGAMANLLLLIACIRHLRTEPSAVGILILQLVSSWMLYCGFYLPMTDIVKLFNYSGKAVGSPYCVIIMTLNTVITVFGNSIDACLAVNRLIAICLPWGYHTTVSPKIINLMTLCAVLNASLGLLPIGGVGGHYTEVARSDFCFYSPTALGASLGLAMILAPDVIIGVCTVLVFGKIIFLRYRKHQRISDGTIPDPPGLRSPVEIQRPRTMQRRINVAVMLFVSFLFTMLCTMPNFILTMHFPWLFSRYPLLSVWMSILFRVQYTICPFVMIGLSSDYSRIIRSMMSNQLGSVTRQIQSNIWPSDTPRSGLSRIRTLPPSDPEKKSHSAAPNSTAD